MRAQRVLRLVVIAFCILMATLVAVAFAEYDILPEVVPAHTVPTVVSLIGVTTLLGVLVGCVAILGGKRWGAWLHLFSSAAGTCVAAFMGPQVVSAASGFIESLIMIATGLIYGLAFFTDALPLDEPNKAPEPTPGSVTPRATEGVSK
jgi:hypothetical protein